MKNSSPFDLCLLSLSHAFVAGDPERAAEPSGPPSFAEVRQGLGYWGLSCVRSTACLAHWTPRLAPTSTGLLFLLIHKAILFYQKFGLIYIHKHIYQHLYLQCYYTRNPAAPTYAFFVNFIWLKNTHKGVKGALGAINDCALGNPWKKISVKWALTQERGMWKGRKPTVLEAV